VSNTLTCGPPPGPAATAISPSSAATLTPPANDGSKASNAHPSPTAVRTVTRDPVADPTAAAGGPEATRAPANAPPVAARVGEIFQSGDWKLVVNGVKSGPATAPTAGRRVSVDFTIKNDRTRAATLSIPATVPLAPRSRPAALDGAAPALRPVQLAEPPALRLGIVDQAERSYGGGFVSAAGQISGSYTFEAAPGDAIRLTFAFDLPPEATDPLALDASFGVDAGGQRARVGLDRPVEPPATLTPSDPPRSAGRDERLQIGSLWAITAQSLEVGGPAADGQRSVTVRLKLENLSDQALIAGATPDDPTGASRDFYAVDAQGQLAYSGADTMPRAIVPPGQSRTVEVKLTASAELATSGPYRLSVIVDARRDRYAIFKLP
jgi:hypothetical protein